MPAKKPSNEKYSVKRTAEVNLMLSAFEIPPMRDVLVIGRKAPIGCKAAKCMADAVSPDRFIVIPINDKVIEAILLRKALLQLMPQELLIPIIIEETKTIMHEESVIKINLAITISVKRTVPL